MMILPPQRQHKVAVILTILLSTLLPFTVARKALGGSGGLLSRGASSQGGGFGESPANDPLKLVDISESSKASWTLPPLDGDEIIQRLGNEHRDVAQYIIDSLGKAPLSIKLNKKRVGMKQQQQQQSFTSMNNASPSSFSNQEKYRAQVLPSSNVKRGDMKRSKLRSVWYISSERASSHASAARQMNEALLTKSYDDNTSQLHPAHFILEVFLPKTRACKGGNPLVRYCIPMGAGTTSPKSRVSQSNGFVTIFPSGRKVKEGETSESVNVGPTSLHLSVGASLIDPAWARGRKFFWKGRNVGQV